MTGASAPTSDAELTPRGPYDRPAMSSGVARRRMRANRLDERQAAAIALVSGLAAAFSDAAPTGSVWVDRPMVGLAVAVATWAAASAPWWVVAGASGISAVAAIDSLLTLIGGVAFVVGLWIGVRQRSLGTVRCAVGAVALNVLCRLELEGFLGASALIGIAVGAALFVTGMRRRRRFIRRRAWTAVGAVLTFAVLAVIGFALAATSARALLSDGQRLATEGIEALSRGDFDDAATKFGEAGRSFHRASNQFDRPWTVPAQLLPVVAQNADAVSDLAEVAGSSSAQLSASLAKIDPDTLRLVGGRFDLAAIEAVAGPLSDVKDSLDALDLTVSDTDSPWLLAPIQTRVARLAKDIDENEQQVDNAVMAARLAPQLLGGDGPRRYLIIFTTPAEARGLGGFMGNFAELTAVDGQITMTRFGRTTELNTGGPNPTGRVVSGPEDWLNQWGRYGFRNGVTGTTGNVPWSNITMSPNFPSTAQVIAELYPQSGGEAIDGVFAIDPYVLAALLEFTGPVHIEATDEELNADNAVEFLLKDQYLLGEGPQRVDLLEQVAKVTIDRLLAGALPNPVTVADSLGDLARQGRFVGWSSNPDEQALLEAVAMSGALPTLDGGDGIAAVINNSGGNKIDVYLERKVAYRASVDPATGQVTATLELTLTNTAPASGLPDVVIGNLVRLPPGTNRCLVSILTALNVVSASRDGSPITVEPGIEQGWNTSRVNLTIPPGGHATITLTLSGTLDLTPGYRLVTRPQPLVQPEDYDVRVVTNSGDVLLVAQEPRDEPGTIEARTESS